MRFKKPVYTFIDNPTYIRKEILETSLDAISLIKNYDRINKIRNQKHDTMKKLQGVMNDCYAEINSLRGHLPIVGKEKSKPSKKVNNEKIKEQIIKNSTLDQELQDIRDKLDQIDI